jgi:hypothetical protein
MLLIIAYCNREAAACDLKKGSATFDCEPVGKRPDEDRAFPARATMPGMAARNFRDEPANGQLDDARALPYFARVTSIFAFAVSPL